MTRFTTVDSREVSRKEFLKLGGGAGLAGAALLASPSSVLAQSGDYIAYREHSPGNFSGGAFTSEVIGAPIAFDTLIPSYNAAMPAGSSVTMEIRVRFGGNWSGWLSLGRYSVTNESSSASTTYANWQTNVDTIQSRTGQQANAYQYRLSIQGAVRVSRVAVVLSKSARHGSQINSGNLQAAWGKDLAVPQRSQYAYDGAGEAWCSPTSINMVMGYWANQTSNDSLREEVPQTARGVYDANYRGWGNWSYNVAYAGARGLRASVSRFNHIQQVERWIEAGIPLVASIAWDNRTSGGRLDNAALNWSNGHLLVIRGFTASGDIITSDPAGSPASEVRRVYNRGQFNRAWQTNGSGGVVYLIHPSNRSTPSSWAAHGSW